MLWQWADPIGLLGRLNYYLTQKKDFAHCFNLVKRKTFHLTSQINKSIKTTWSEIMRPMWDAVSLVDANEGDGRQHLENPAEEAASTGYRFRRHEEEVQFPGLDPIDAFLLHCLWVAGVKARGLNELRQSSDLKQGMFIIFVGHY